MYIYWYLAAFRPAPNIQPSKTGGKEHLSQTLSQKEIVKIPEKISRREREREKKDSSEKSESQARPARILNNEERNANKQLLNRQERRI